LPKLVNIFHHFPHIFKIFRVTAPYFFLLRGRASQEPISAEPWVPGLSPDLRRRRRLRCSCRSLRRKLMRYHQLMGVLSHNL
jgi:hypothetical protein